MSFALTSLSWPAWAPPPVRVGGWRGLVSLSRAVGAGWFRGGGRSARMLAVRQPASGGDFSAVVLPHLDAAYSLARFLTRDSEAAEDVVQDAVLKAHRAFAGYRGGDPKAWLLTIVRREFIDWSNARRAARSVFVAETPEDTPDGEGRCEDDTPEQALLRKGEIEAVRQAIEALPEPFREALVLRELEELSYRQVAEIAGVPIGTVMSRLARAREMLARRLIPAEAREPEAGR